MNSMSYEDWFWSVVLAVKEGRTPDVPFFFVSRNKYHGDYELRLYSPSSKQIEFHSVGMDFDALTKRGEQYDRAIRKRLHE